MADQELVAGLSKLIGYGIVLPAFFVLIPQILKVTSWCFPPRKGVRTLLSWALTDILILLSSYTPNRSLLSSYTDPGQVWEAGSGEGLSIPLQAQELAMLVIGWHHHHHHHHHDHHHDHQQQHHHDAQQEDDQAAVTTGELVFPWMPGEKPFLWESSAWFDHHHNHDCDDDEHGADHDHDVVYNIGDGDG